MPRPRLPQDMSPPATTLPLIPRPFGPPSDMPGGFEDEWPLSANHLPSKFSSLLLSPGMRKRKRGNSPSGVEDITQHDDFSPIDRPSRQVKKMRWNGFKWTLCVANSVLTIYAILAFIFCLLTWFDVWKHADVVRLSNRSELAFSTVASILGIIASIIGWAGILLNNRSFLAVYTFLLWFVFAFATIPGYTAYHRRTFNLQGKLNLQWSRDFGPPGRLRVQNQLRCCGYNSPFVEATVSQTCYARSILPGCKKYFLDFQRLVLGRWYRISFGLVPLHLGVILAGLLCSNHVTDRFGKGMMPKAYRFNERSMRIVMEKYAKQLANTHGTDLAADILSQSLSRINGRSNSSNSTPKMSFPRARTPANYMPSSLGRPSKQRVQTSQEPSSTPPTPPPKSPRHSREFLHSPNDSRSSIPFPSPSTADSQSPPTPQQPETSNKAVVKAIRKTRRAKLPFKLPKPDITRTRHKDRVASSSSLLKAAGTTAEESNQGSSQPSSSSKIRRPRSQVVGSNPPVAAAPKSLTRARSSDGHGHAHHTAYTRHSRAQQASERQHQPQWEQHHQQAAFPYAPAHHPQLYPYGYPDAYSQVYLGPHDMAQTNSNLDSDPLANSGSYMQPPSQSPYYYYYPPQAYTAAPEPSEGPQSSAQTFYAYLVSAPTSGLYVQHPQQQHPTPDTNHE